MTGLSTHNLLGPGPVYPGVYTDPGRWRRATVVEMSDPRYSDVPRPKNWLGVKVLWKISTAYRGPVWISGSRVNSSESMKFSGGAAVSRVLHFRAHGAWPSQSFVPEPGCYAWHIRGRGFHLTLVFRAVCLADRGAKPCG